MVLLTVEHLALHLLALEVLVSINEGVQKDKKLDLDHVLLQNATVGDVVIQVSNLKIVLGNHLRPEMAGEEVVSAMLALTLEVIQIVFLWVPKKDEESRVLLRWREHLVN